MSSDERARIVAGNEVLYREINEIIEAGQWPGESHGRAFRCECAQLGCAGLIEMTPGDYEALRANPRRFVVLPGHHDPTIEDVVGVQPDYVIVEKRGAAGDVAEASDPRA
jgi:hypothetical protein